MSNKVIILGTIGAIIGLIKWFKMYSNYKGSILLIEELVKADVITVDELYKLIAKPLSYTGFVQGILDTFKEQYVESKIVPGIKLLYSKLVLSTYNLRNSASIYRTSLSQRMSSIFKLIDPKTGKSIKILETLMTNFGNWFLKLKSRTQRRSSYLSKNYHVSVFQLLIILFIQVLIAFSKYKNILFILSSGFLSWYHEEIYEQFYLPPGKKAVVYGKLSQKKDGLYIYKPKFIAKSKQTLISMLRHQKDISKRLLIMFSLILFPLIGWLSFKILKSILLHLDNRWQRMIDEQALQMNQLTVTKYECPRCTTNIRNIITKSCFHLSHCRNCINKNQTKCSQCQKYFSTFVQLFVS